MSPWITLPPQGSTYRRGYSVQMNGASSHYKAQMQINDPAYTPDTSDMKLVVLLFPEIFV